MEQVTRLFEVVRAVLSRTALKDAVASRPISAGDQHVLVLSDVSVGLAAGGGSGSEPSKRHAAGTGGAGGGGAKARPVAVLVVENGEVRVEPIGR
jgi:uncharacterized spore protein YtfJ